MEGRVGRVENEKGRQMKENGGGGSKKGGRRARHRMEERREMKEIGVERKEEGRRGH